MQRTLPHLLSAILLALSMVASATNAEEEQAFEFLEIDEFPALDDFENAAAFQAHIDDYVRRCRDAWISSSVGTRCGIAASLWDRELNLAYKALMGALGDDVMEKLKISQRSWLAFRDETMSFSKVVLDLHYNDGQRMWVPIRSLDYSEILAGLTSARTLQLRRWKQQLENPVSELM